MIIYIVGHKNPDTDSVCAAISLSELKNKLGDDTKPAIQGEINKETNFVLEKFNIDKPEILTDSKDKKVILVDHSDILQSLENIDSAQIIGIVDHHKLGDITTSAPLEIWAQPFGSSCTIIKLMYDFYNIKISKDIAGAMLCAILSDTVILKSATTTDEDKKAADELSRLAGISDIHELGMDMFKVKSSVDDMTAKELVLKDFKDFSINGEKIGIGQIEIIDISLLDKIKDSLIEEIKNLKNEGRHTVILLLTDIIKEGSEMIIFTDNSTLIENAFNKKIVDNKLFLEGVMSRKKQILPPLERAFLTI